MKIEYARAADREEILAFLLSVFQRNNPKHAPFEDIYPDLFLPDDEVMGRHAVIREDGRIAACVGTYPMLLQICGCRVLTAGVGQGATRLEPTGKGYMTALLNQELDRCRREGCVLGWLGGRRDRYSHFGFDVAGLNYDYYMDAHSLRHVARSRRIDHVKATEPGAITEAMFALRDKTVNSVIEPLDTFRLQMTRLGFDFEIWTATPEGAEAPDAWAVVDASHGRIEEWCGSLDGRAEIALACAERGKVMRMETCADVETSAFLREASFYRSPSGRNLCVLDRDGLVAAMRPFLPKGFAMPPDSLSPCELVRTLFGPDPGSAACLPFCMPGIFHV